MKKPNIKEKLKKLGKKAVLNCLISLYNAKANQHSKKSSKYRKTAQGYKSKLEEITGYKEATRKEPKNSNLESTVNNGYHASMEEFYQKCESENNISTSEIGKILAGDYRENGKRTWYWKDRIKKVKEYLKNNQGISELTQKQIFSILNKNKYFMRKKKTELISLKNVLFKNERIKKEINYHLQNTFYPKQETQSPKMIKKEYPTRIKDILKKTLYDKEEATNPSGSLENTLERETVKYDGKLVTLPSKGNLTVVGKIEGNLYLFNHIIKKFEEEYKNNKKTYLLLLGNYLDYSYVANVESDGITDDSITILNKLIKLNKKYGDNIISLTGEKELLHYLRDASEGHAWQKSSVREYKEEFIEKKEKELKEHAKYLERQPIAALIPKKFLFVASGPFKEIKSLKSLANLKYLEKDEEYNAMVSTEETNQMLDSLHNGRSNFKSESDYINAGWTMLNELGLKGTIYGDGSGGYKPEIKGHQLNFWRGSYLKLDLLKNYRDLYDLKMDREILRFNL